MGRWLLLLGLLQLPGGPAAGACPCQDPRLCHPVTGTGGFEVWVLRRLCVPQPGLARPGGCEPRGVPRAGEGRSRGGLRGLAAR